MLPIVGIIVGVIFTIWMTYLPETPLYLLSQQKIKAAELSADFYNYEMNTNEVAEKSDEKADTEKRRSITWDELGKTNITLLITIRSCFMSRYNSFEQLSQRHDEQL